MAPIWKPKDNAILQEWLEAIENEANKELTSWEINFIDSISYRINAGQTLSQKQEEILERIYAEKT